ncbi:hypothetical protein ACF0H5_016536 [Mactra antiquata]
MPSCDFLRNKLWLCWVESKDDHARSIEDTITYTVSLWFGTVTTGFDLNKTFEIKHLNLENGRGWSTFSDSNSDN